MANKLNLNLSGGMNLQTSSLIIKDSEAELVLNYHLDKLGALTKRYGYSIYASQPTTTPVTGMGQFTDSSTGTNYQLMVSTTSGSGRIYYNNAGTWTEALTTDTSSKKTRFVTFIDYVFRVNGADVVKSSANASTWGTTNCPATIIPAYAAVFQDRVYLANGISSNLSRLWYSSLPSAGAITWTTASDFIDINPDDGDQITALENNGNRLLIFKRRSLYRWTFGQVEPDRLIGVGTSSQESVKTNFDVGITFFANQFGVYAYTTGRPKLISRKIQPFIDGVSDWAEVYGEVDRDHYYLFVGNVTVDGRSYVNTMLVYNIPLDAWVVYTLGDKVTWMSRFIVTQPIEKIYLGGNTGKTYLFLDGKTDYSPTTSSAEPQNVRSISAEFVSKEYILSFPNRTNLNWIDVFSSMRVEAGVFYDVDRQNDFVEVGNVTQSVTNFRTSKRECNSVRIKIADNSKNDSVVNGFNFEHEPKEKRDELTVNIRRKGSG